MVPVNLPFNTWAPDGLLTIPAAERERESVCARLCVCTCACLYERDAICTELPEGSDGQLTGVVWGDGPDLQVLPRLRRPVAPQSV